MTARFTLSAFAYSSPGHRLPSAWRMVRNYSIRRLTHEELRSAEYADCGAAQRLYVRRGYVPDGRGIHYDGRPVPGGEHVADDDDLVLYLVKDLAPDARGEGVTLSGEV
ncbi:MAG TPA: hypothetical protein VFR37_09055 [Longimicrobium sp.]|nr:hypothetical protein [Longimicrobium sp.]